MARDGDPAADGARRHVRHYEVRITRVPTPLALILAVPLVLAVGIVAVTALALGVAALIVAPRLLGRARTAAGNADTITLDPSSYRRQPADGERLRLGPPGPARR
jgi:hypothetical protein